MEKSNDLLSGGTKSRYFSPVFSDGTGKSLTARCDWPQFSINHKGINMNWDRIEGNWK